MIVFKFLLPLIIPLTFATKRTHKSIEPDQVSFWDLNSDILTVILYMALQAPERPKERLTRLPELKSVCKGWLNLIDRVVEFKPESFAMDELLVRISIDKELFSVYHDINGSERYFQKFVPLQNTIERFPSLPRGFFSTEYSIATVLDHLLHLRGIKPSSEDGLCNLKYSDDSLMAALLLPVIETPRDAKCWGEWISAVVPTVDTSLEEGKYWDVLQTSIFILRLFIFAFQKIASNRNDSDILKVACFYITKNIKLSQEEDMKSYPDSFGIGYSFIRWNNNFNIDDPEEQREAKRIASLSFD